MDHFSLGKYAALPAFDRPGRERNHPRARLASGSLNSLSSPALRHGQEPDRRHLGRCEMDCSSSRVVPPVSGFQRTRAPGLSGPGPAPPSRPGSPSSLPVAGRGRREPHPVARRSGSAHGRDAETPAGIRACFPVRVSGEGRCLPKLNRPFGPEFFVSQAVRDSFTLKGAQTLVWRRLKSRTRIDVRCRSTRRLSPICRFHGAFHGNNGKGERTGLRGELEMDSSSGETFSRNKRVPSLFLPNDPSPAAHRSAEELRPAPHPPVHGWTPCTRRPGTAAPITD